MSNRDGAASTNAQKRKCNLEHSFSFAQGGVLKLSNYPQMSQGYI